jgi:hypothetical protein
VQAEQRIDEVSGRLAAEVEAANSRYHVAAFSPKPTLQKPL